MIDSASGQRKIFFDMFSRFDTVKIAVFQKYRIARQVLHFL